MTPQQQKIEQTAFKFRQHIRAKAGLLCDWSKASLDMKNWYRDLAVKYLENNGELNDSTTS